MRGWRFETYLRRVVFLSKTFKSPKVLVMLRKRWFRPEMTEILLTWTLSLRLRLIVFYCLRYIKYVQQWGRATSSRNINYGPSPINVYRNVTWQKTKIIYITPINMEREKNKQTFPTCTVLFNDLYSMFGGNFLAILVSCRVLVSILIVITYHDRDSRKAKIASYTNRAQLIVMNVL